MGIKFCNVCKGLLVESNGSWICIVCQKKHDYFSLVSSEDIAINLGIQIVNEEEYETLPKTDWNCPKCGNKEAYFWNLIITASDEADTIYHRCTRCTYTVQKGGQRGGR